MGQISESDIGKRVTIRLHDDPGYRDLVGQLISPTSLKNRHGQVIDFDPEKIYIWREINEVPRTATSGAPLSVRIYDLERILNKTWKAREEKLVGNWIFRADVGITRRANSGLILGPGNHIDELINWYQSRNMMPTVAFAPEIHRDIDAELASRGFEISVDSNVMVKDGVKSEINFEYEISDLPNKNWLAVYNDDAIKPLLERTPAKYLSLSESNQLVAIGRIAFADDWAVLSRIWVAPEHRGKGFGRKILRALENESAGTKLALQVEKGNEIATKLYESEGYQIHHSYRFRALSQQINLSQESCC